MTQQSAQSLKYIKVPVASTRDRLPYDPHGDVIQMAFPRRGVDPVAGDWQAPRERRDLLALLFEKLWIRRARDTKRHAERGQHRHS